MQIQVNSKFLKTSKMLKIILKMQTEVSLTFLVQIKVSILQINESVILEETEKRRERGKKTKNITANVHKLLLEHK